MCLAQGPQHRIIVFQNPVGCAKIARTYPTHEGNGVVCFLHYTRRLVAQKGKGYFLRGSDEVAAGQNVI